MEKGLWNDHKEGFYYPGLKSGGRHFCPQFHCPGFSHLATYNFKGTWKCSLPVCPTEKGNVLVSNYQFLTECLCSRDSSKNLTCMNSFYSVREKLLITSFNRWELEALRGHPANQCWRKDFNPDYLVWSATLFTIYIDDIEYS